MKRRVAVIATLALSAACIAGIPWVDAQAADGWTMTDGEWRYYEGRDSQPVTQAWRESRGFWFYLSEDGTMLKNRLFWHRESIYYVDQDGRRAQNAWVYVDGQNGIGDGFEEGWYYFGSNGKGYRRTGESFKKQVGEDTYIFDENGKMLTGWINEDGEPVEDEDAFVEGMYYAREDGRLLNAEWLEYGSTDEGMGGSSLDSEVAGRNYRDYDQMWFFFDSSCKKVKSNGEHPKQKAINGATYGFDENGVMLSWWGKVATVSNADKSNPTSDVSARYYSGYDGGQLLRDTWFWMYPSENLDQDDFDNQESSWWYADSKGEVYRNRIRTINGRAYAFDGIGRMRTGFVLFDGKSEFVAQYDVDAWESGDFINGSLYGIEKADLYLFSPDELNDGSMQTGNDIAVELADGVYHFGFASNGKAFGNRNQLQKRNDRYYINGLRLDADEEYGYGVVQVEDGDETYYQVVDTKGKVVEGKQKIVKDKDGAYLLIIRNRFMAWCGDEDKPRWRDGPEGTGFYHYDRDNDEDHYAEGLIASSDTEPDISGLPEEQRLNF